MCYTARLVAAVADLLLQRLLWFRLNTEVSYGKRK
jgi:hypothetical protein